MNPNVKLVVSHAPFWHDGGSITSRNYQSMLAALPAILAGVILYGAPAVAVVCFSVATAMIWELSFNLIAKRPISIGDGNAALIGLILAMLLPATTPWWIVLIGTFLAVIVAKQIYGGIGANPFNPACVAFAVLMLSWNGYLNFEGALTHYDFGFAMVYPLSALKHFGVDAIRDISVLDLLLGRQIGGIGATFSLGLIAGGIYLMARGIIRWEISLSFLAGIFVTASIFYAADSTRFAGPIFHLLSGYTLIGAFFLVAEDSSSPVNFWPMVIYGALGGFLTILIRNIGAYEDGVVFAILFVNVANPLIDKIRPKALGKVS